MIMIGILQIYYLLEYFFIEGNVLKSLEYMLIAYNENNPDDKDGLELL